VLKIDSAPPTYHQAMTMSHLPTRILFVLTLMIGPSHDATVARCSIWCSFYALSCTVEPAFKDMLQTGSLIREVEELTLNCGYKDNILRESLFPHN
jgi:hypothetical protein